MTAMKRNELDELANLLAQGGGASPSGLTGFVVARLTTANESDWIGDIYDGDDPRAVELLKRLRRSLKSGLESERFSWPNPRDARIDWCAGYMWSVDRDQTFHGLASNEKIQSMLFPIALAGGYLEFEVEPGYDRDQIIDDALAKVPEAAMQLWWYFEKLRKAVEKTEPEVGRNAPCPCGSGKKYKRCCLN